MLILAMHSYSYSSCCSAFSTNYYQSPYYCNHLNNEYFASGLGNNGKQTQSRLHAMRPSNNGSVNPYKVLNVPIGADKSRIKRAYKKAAMKYHPDLNKDPGAAEKFIEISAAYEMLMSKVRSTTYGSGSYGEQTMWDGSTSSVFEDMGQSFPEGYGQGATYQPKASSFQPFNNVRYKKAHGQHQSRGTRPSGDRDTSAYPFQSSAGSGGGVASTNTWSRSVWSNQQVDTDKANRVRPPPTPSQFVSSPNKAANARWQQPRNFGEEEVWKPSVAEDYVDVNGGNVPNGYYQSTNLSDSQLNNSKNMRKVSRPKVSKPSATYASSRSRSTTPRPVSSRANESNTSSPPPISKDTSVTKKQEKARDDSLKDDRWKTASGSSAFEKGASVVSNPNYTEKADVSAQTLGSIFSDLANGVAAAKAGDNEDPFDNSDSSKGGILQDLISFLEGNPDLLELLSSGTLNEVCAEKDEADKLTKQLEGKYDSIKSDILETKQHLERIHRNRQRSTGGESSNSNNIVEDFKMDAELNEILEASYALQKVVLEYIKKSWRRVDLLQARLDELLVEEKEKVRMEMKASSTKAEQISSPRSIPRDEEKIRQGDSNLYDFEDDTSNRRSHSRIPTFEVPSSAFGNTGAPPNKKKHSYEKLRTEFKSPAQSPTSGISPFHAPSSTFGKKSVRDKANSRPSQNKNIPSVNTSSSFNAPFSFQGTTTSPPPVPKRTQSFYEDSKKRKTHSSLWSSFGSSGREYSSGVIKPKNDPKKSNGTYSTKKDSRPNLRTRIGETFNPKSSDESNVANSRRPFQMEDVATKTNTQTVSNASGKNKNKSNGGKTGWKNSSRFSEYASVASSSTRFSMKESLGFSAKNKRRAPSHHHASTMSVPIDESTLRYEPLDFSEHRTSSISSWANDSISQSKSRIIPLFDSLQQRLHPLLRVETPPVFPNEDPSESYGIPFCRDGDSHYDYDKMR